MEYLNYVIPVVVFAGVIAAIVINNKKSGGDDIVIPPATQRTDLLYGYYGSARDQIEEVRGHTNLHWEMLWQGSDGAVRDMQATNRPVVLDVDTLIIAGTKGNRSVNTEAEKNLRALFNILAQANVLKKVRAIVPCDEPNLPGDNRTHLLIELTGIIRKVVADYPDLAGVRLGIVYAGRKDMPYTELFDIVGFDDYDMKSEIFKAGGDYDQLKAKLKPEQKTWVFPGGIYGQDPTPFVNFANSHPEVWAIIPFLWTDPVNGETFIGIRSIPEMKDAYTKAGKQVTGYE